MPTPDYSQAGVNRDRPAVMPATGSVLRRELTKARVVELPDGIVDGDVLTFDAASSAIVAEAPVLPPSPPTGTGFRHIDGGVEDGASFAPSAVSQLVGSSSASSVDWTRITLGTNLSMSGTTLNASGGSSSWTETELDFGTAPVASKSFTVTDGTVSGTSKIVVMPSGNAPTGGYSDIWQWDAITLAAKAGTGSFTIHAAVGNGTTNGKHKVYYQVA